MTHTHLSALVLAAALLLVACKSDKEDSPEVLITPLGEAPAGAASIFETPAAASTPGVALTPQVGLSVDLAAARRLEAEGNIESAAAAYVAIAAGESAERDVATLASARVLLLLERPEGRAHPARAVPGAR